MYKYMYYNQKVRETGQFGLPITNVLCTFYLSQLVEQLIMSPPLRGMETYCFWCGSRRLWRWCRYHTFLSAQYLVNQWLVSYQTFMDILMGHNKELVRFWWPWPNFQGHSSRKTESSLCWGTSVFSKNMVTSFCYIHVQLLLYSSRKIPYST